MQPTVTMTAFAVLASLSLASSVLDPASSCACTNELSIAYQAESSVDFDNFSNFLAYALGSSTSSNLFAIFPASAPSPPSVHTAHGPAPPKPSPPPSVHAASVHGMGAAPEGMGMSMGMGMTPTVHDPMGGAAAPVPITVHGMGMAKGDEDEVENTDAESYDLPHTSQKSVYSENFLIQFSSLCGDAASGLMTEGIKTQLNAILTAANIPVTVDSVEAVSESECCDCADATAGTCLSEGQAYDTTLCAPTVTVTGAMLMDIVGSASFCSSGFQFIVQIALGNFINVNPYNIDITACSEISKSGSVIYEYSMSVESEDEQNVRSALEFSNAAAFAEMFNSFVSNFGVDAALNDVSNFSPR